MKKGLSIFLFSFLMFSVNAQIYKLEQLTSKENIEKLKKDFFWFKKSFSGKKN